MSSSRDGRAPELTLCAAPDYAERRRRQLAIAEELRRCREQIARLGPLVAEATDAYAMADARARARWQWVQEGVPVVDLPVAALQESHPAGLALSLVVTLIFILDRNSEQDGLLEHNALAAAVWALQPTGPAPAPAPATAVAAEAAAAGSAMGGCGSTAQRPWCDLATAEEGEALRGCRVLLSRAPPERTVPDLACWRCWLWRFTCH